MKIPRRYADAKYEDVPENIRTAFEAIKETRKGMYIHGSVGTGKTHIFYSLAKKWDEEQDGFRPPIIWNMTELLAEFRRDFDRPYVEKREIDQRIMYGDGLLFLDDVGAEKMSDWVEETFYLIINVRYNSIMPVIITSNLSISELASRVGDRTASRIVEMCDIFHLDGKDRRIPS